MLASSGLIAQLLVHLPKAGATGNANSGKDSGLVSSISADSSSFRVARMSLKILSVLAKWSSKLTVQMMEHGAGSQLVCILDSGGVVTSRIHGSKGDLSVDSSHHP